MLKSFGNVYLNTGVNVLKNFVKNNNKIFRLMNYNFSAKSHDNHHNHNDSHDDHGHGHAHHHKEPQEYHELKYDRVSYNQQMTPENRPK
jgi:hypothetical protein